MRSITGSALPHTSGEGHAVEVSRRFQSNAVCGCRSHPMARGPIRDVRNTWRFHSAQASASLAVQRCV